ncbi:hypothetical protein RM543_13910 [Roseicyclus sp. F158]|uniref:Uncharacterized protein n=1 Tax=Tropicimonas omnivorans TaxID=3075590 RepID=A0ABU3DJ88_9RHOB|nr:hypothetical protein [Roseicyclus sp. F158]MDT0683783.1 hypothetical protein [Roseicyclus sp. F158]
MPEPASLGKPPQDATSPSMTETAYRLTFTHTHLYPGATGTFDADPPESAAILATFSDGVTVGGWIEGDVLTLDAHRTAAGTPIAEKSWRVEREGTTLRVIHRA